MTEVEVFPKAPIVEALLDIQFPLMRVDAETLFRGFDQEISKEFPRREPRKMIHGGFEIAADGIPKILEPTVQAEGFAFTSSDKTRVVQARQNGFSYSQLQPYRNWDDLRDNARRLWDVLLRHAQPAGVERIALRFINRIPVPMPVKEFTDYITTMISVAPGIPQAVEELFFRLVIPKHIGTRQIKGIVTCTLEPIQTAPTPVLPIVFDIDVFAQVSILSPNSQEIWDLFEGLRTFKNEIFFSSTTEKAKALFR